MHASRTLGFSIVTAIVATLTAACGSHEATGAGGSGAGSPATSGSGAGSTTAGTGASGGAGAGTTSSSASSSSSGSAVGGIFQAQEPWNTPCDQDPVDPSSDTIIQWLASAGGWGNGNVLQIDTSINIQYANASTPMMPFTVDGSCSPDCDDISAFPVPPGGAVEGEQGYACECGGDCHLLVVDSANNTLYEMYGAFNPAPTSSDPTFYSAGGAYLWDLTKAYPPNERGDGCTSADAGGFPVAAMLFTADEVAAGHIDHAIRFILPNARIRDGDVYVHPASHDGTNTHPMTRPDAPPYGVHFRLKASFDLTQLGAGAQVIAKAMQKYGMFLADGGEIALTAADDRFTTAKWTDADVNVGSKDLAAIQVTDFDVVDLGTIVTTGDTCVRNP